MTTAVLSQIPASLTLFERVLLGLSARLEALVLAKGRSRASASRRRARDEEERRIESSRDLRAAAHTGMLLG